MANPTIGFSGFLTNPTVGYSGFLTNPTEEKFLNTQETQRQMAGSMFTAFEKYKNELEGVDEKTDNITKLPDYQKDVKKETPKDNGVNNSDVIFRVQIETSEKKIALSSEKFKGQKVFEYTQDGYYKYTVGSFVNDYSAANLMKRELRENGFEHAFVVGFVGEERINLQKAIKLAEN